MNNTNTSQNPVITTPLQEPKLTIKHLVRVANDLIRRDINRDRYLAEHTTYRFGWIKKKNEDLRSKDSNYRIELNKWKRDMNSRWESLGLKSQCDITWKDNDSITGFETIPVWEAMHKGLYIGWINAYELWTAEALAQAGVKREFMPDAVAYVSNSYGRYSQRLNEFVKELKGGAF